MSSLFQLFAGVGKIISHTSVLYLKSFIHFTGLPIFFVLAPLLIDLANGSDPMQDIVIQRASIPS